MADDRTVLGIEHDRLESDDKFLRHLAQAVRNALGDRAGTCIDPKTQIVEGKTVCLVSCQRSPEPVYLRWKGVEKTAEGDLYVRSGPGTVRLDGAGCRQVRRDPIWLASTMIKRRATGSSSRPTIRRSTCPHTFRAGHASPDITRLYDRMADTATFDERRGAAAS